MTIEADRLVSGFFKENEIKTAQDYRLQRSDLEDNLIELIDSSQIVIYTSQAIEYLQESKNSNAYLDHGVELDTTKGFCSIASECAFWALYDDVVESLEELANELPDEE